MIFGDLVIEGVKANFRNIGRCESPVRAIMSETSDTEGVGALE